MEELKNINEFLMVSSTITKVDSDRYTVQPEDELIFVTSKSGCYITLPTSEEGRKLIVKDGSGYTAKYQIQITTDKNVNYYINSSYGSLRFLCDENGWKVHDHHYGFGKIFMKQTNVCTNGILYNEITFRSGLFSDYNTINIENRNATVIRNHGPDQKWNVVLNLNHDKKFSIHVGDKTIDNQKDAIVDIKNGETLWISVNGIIEKSSIAIIQIA